MSEIEERKLIRWLSNWFDARGSFVHTGIEDDAAIVDLGGEHLHALSADTILEGRHFTRQDAAFDEIGRKAAAVSLSDMAAVAARPVCMLVSSGFGAGLEEEDVKAIFQGIKTTTAAFECSVIGGDLFETEEQVQLTTFALGTCPHGPVRRRGAQEGDRLFVTGPLGGSILDRHLNFTPRVEEALALAEHDLPGAMIDVSDGLIIDLERVLDASGGLGATLEEELIPVHPDAETIVGPEGHSPLHHAFYDGEDFELLLSVPEEKAAKARKFDEAGVSLTEIGRVTGEGAGLILQRRDGTEEPVDPGGYEHFSS